MSPLAIVIIINILFFALLGLGVFLGYKRGLEYQSLHFGFVFVALLISLFITNPIASAILSIKVKGEAIGTMLLNILGGVADASPTLKYATLGTVSSLISPAVFLAVGIIVYLLFELAYQLIVRLLLKKKNLITKRKSLRGFGTIVGFAEMFFFIVLLFMPLTSLSRTFIRIIDEPATQVESVAFSEDADDGKTSISELAHKYVPEFVVDVLEEYNDSPMGRIVCMGGFDNYVYGAMTNIKSGRNHYTINDHFAQFIKLLDDAMKEITYYYNNYQIASIEPVKETLNAVIDSDLEGFIERVLRELIYNKETLYSSLGLDEDYKEPLIDVMDKYKSMLDDNNFDLSDYLNENVDIVLDSVDSLAKTGGLDALLNVAKGEKLETIITEENFSSFTNTAKILITAPVFEDAYDVLYFAMQREFPSVITNMVEVELIDTYDKASYEFPRIFELLTIFAGTEVNGSNLFDQFLNSNMNLVDNIINSDNAKQIFEKLTETKSLRGIVITTFYNIDEDIKSALKSIAGDVRISDKMFSKTVSYSLKDSEIEAFINKVSGQIDDILEVARYASQNGISKENLPEFLNLIRGKIAARIDNNTNESSSVLTTMFNNIVNFFSGKIVIAGEDVPAFSLSQEFNNKVDEEYSKLENVPEKLKLYFVDFENILKDLI